jgi:hypothetical protein
MPLQSMHQACITLSRHGKQHLIKAENNCKSEKHCYCVTVIPTRHVSSPTPTLTTSRQRIKPEKIQNTKKDASYTISKTVHQKQRGIKIRTPPKAIDATLLAKPIT